MTKTTKFLCVVAFCSTFLVGTMVDGIFNPVVRTGEATIVEIEYRLTDDTRLVYVVSDDTQDLEVTLDEQT